TVDTASAAEPYPTLPWAPEVPNKFPAKKGTMVLDEGTYLYNTGNTSNSCGSLPYWYNPQEYVGVQWQGGTEFTVGGNGDVPPVSGVYDGKNVSCTTVTLERAINETSVLTTTIEVSSFNLRAKDSFAWN